MILEYLKFEFQHVVDMTVRRGSSIQEVNFMIVRSMRWDFFCYAFQEDVSVLMIIVRDML